MNLYSIHSGINRRFALFFMSVAIVLTPFPSAADQPLSAATPLPYQAQYNARIKGLHLEAYQGLRQLANGQYEIATNASAFYIALSQRSVFTLEQGIPRPINFDLSQKLLGINSRTYSIRFDGALAHYLAGSNQIDIPIPAGTQDVLSIQYMLSRWLAKGETEIQLPVVSRSKLKQYRFKITDETMLQVPAGRFNAIKVERIDDPQKRDIYWFAKDWDYMLLKMETHRGNGKADYLELSSGVVGGRRMVGR